MKPVERLRAAILTTALVAIAFARQVLDGERAMCPSRGALRRRISVSARKNWKRLAAREVPRRDRAVRSAYGVLLVDRPVDSTFRFCVKGTYGFFFANLLRRWKKPFMLLDIGANIGLYSLLAARSRNGRRIIAFEPDPVSAEYLRRNARLNHARIDVVEAAVSDSSRTESLLASPNHSGASRLAGAGDGPTSVRVRTLSGVDLEDLLGDPPLGADVIVKLDVEGHEYPALAGLRAWRHWKEVAAVWIELSQRTDRTACIDSLTGDGFEIRAWVGDAGHTDVLFVRASTSTRGVAHGLPRSLVRHSCHRLPGACA